MLTHKIEILKSEFRAIKFLKKRELQQITITVIIIGVISALGFSALDVLMNFLVQKLLMM